MKSLIIPALLALAIHGALLSLDLPKEKPRLLLPDNHSVTVTLSSIAPQPVERVAPLPVVAPSPLAPLTPLALKKSVPRPVSRPQPNPKPTPKPLPVSAAPAIVPTAPSPASALESESADPSTEAVDAPAVSGVEPSLPANAGAVSGDAVRGEDQVKITTSVPLYDVNPPMGYPSLARRRNLEGTLLLRVLVDADGHVGEIQLVRSSGHGILDRWAQKSVSRWQFKPATRNGTPIDFWVEVPVVFKLQ